MVSLEQNYHLLSAIMQGEELDRKEEEEQEDGKIEKGILAEEEVLEDGEVEGTREGENEEDELEDGEIEEATREDVEVEEELEDGEIE